jgi:ribosome biogenesis protein YTM1
MSPYPTSDDHDDESPMLDEEETTTKLRISFILSPSIRSQTQRDALTLPSDPIAVPASIRKKGLSAVVNHLLDRKVPTDDDDEEEGDEDDDESKLPAIPFDFLLNDKLLRLPLDSAVRKEGLSTERAIELQYFPARVPPVVQGESEVLPDWITAMDYNDAVVGGGGSEDELQGGVLFTGGADGVVRSFSSSSSSKGKLQPTCHGSAHTGPIHCLSSIVPNNNSNVPTTLVATGSIDQTLVTHMYRRSTDSATSSLELHAVYSGGHTNSIGSVALLNNTNNGTTMLASGDWDGGLAIWSVPPTEKEDGADISNRDAIAENHKKKRKGGGGTSNATHTTPTIHEVKPITSIKAHSSNISGLAFGYNGTTTSTTPTTLLTGSWDHGLKVYDIERMDCILSLNGSRVVTSLCRCPNSNVVATSSPDCTVRLWDMRTNGEGHGGSGMDKSLRQR